MHGRDAIASERLDGGAFRALDLASDDAEFGHCSLLSLPSCCALRGRASARRLHSPYADLGATLWSGSHEMARSVTRTRNKEPRDGSQSAGAVACHAAKAGTADGSCGFRETGLRMWVAAFVSPCSFPRSEAGRSAALASESRTFGSRRARKLLSMMQRLAFGGIPSFFAAPLSPSRRLKRLQSVLSPLCSGFRPTEAHC